MTKDKLIEALETALAVLTQPTITFTLPKREPLSNDVYVVQETSSDDIEFVFENLEDAKEYVKAFNKEETGYSFRVMKGIVWRRGKDEQ